MAELGSTPGGNDGDLMVPRCIVVLGPRAAGKTQWIQQFIRTLFDRRPGARVAVLLAEEGRTRMEGFIQSISGVAVRKMFIPCLCCPGAVDLPGTARSLVSSAQAGWLFLELPVLAAPGLMEEFDRVLRWPRSIVACLTPAWVKAQASQSLSPFQTALLGEANSVITDRAAADVAVERLLSNGSAMSPETS